MQRQKQDRSEEKCGEEWRRWLGDYTTVDGRMDSLNNMTKPVVSTPSYSLDGQMPLVALSGATIFLAFRFLPLSLRRALLRDAQRQHSAQLVIESSFAWVCEIGCRLQVAQFLVVLDDRVQEGPSERERRARSGERGHRRAEGHEARCHYDDAPDDVAHRVRDSVHLAERAHRDLVVRVEE